MGGMTPRQHRFVREYLVDRNGAGAAVRAGYSRRTARQTAYELLDQLSWVRSLHGLPTASST